MYAQIVPAFLRSTLGRLQVRGLPSTLAHVSRWTLGSKPRVWRTAGGFELHLDPLEPDQCMMYYGFYSRGVEHCARQILRPGDTAFDIGGQVGYFAATFAQAVGPAGHVHTFEPDPAIWPRLQRALVRNPDLQIRAHRQAIAGMSGQARFHVSPTAGWSTLMECDYEATQTIEVACQRLDDLRSEDLHWSKLRLIKMDVEGAEIDALHGMHATLSQYRPHILCEVNTPCLTDGGRSPAELLEILESHDYDLLAIVEPKGLIRSHPPTLVPVRKVADLPFTVGDLWCQPRGGVTT